MPLDDWATDDYVNVLIKFGDVVFVLQRAGPILRNWSLLQIGEMTAD